MNLCCPDPLSDGPQRLLAEQALSRAGGAPLVQGNSVRILKDAEEHFPAWLSVIASAQRTVFLENYIFADDEVGSEFVSALAARARDGVRVRVICDWLGSIRTSGRFWHPLMLAGGEVRIFNPPQLARPFGWLTRDHRKMLTVDGRIGFITGLCVSSKWLGDPARGVAPWRDTGVEIRGPALRAIEDAFAQTWAAIGTPLPEEELTPVAEMPEAGDVALRVLAATPNLGRLYRLDQLIAAIARERLWLADAYFIGVAPYVQALRSAALDGVDVRLLVPGASDLPLVRTVSRAGYRPLLDAGVRVFEWNGPMLHAKTAVADSRWARIGSTNLNISSWLGNYELDVAVEDTRFAVAMEHMYEEDLRNATEIILGVRGRVCPMVDMPRHHRRGDGSASRAAAGAIRLGHSVGAAIADRRNLGPAEAGIMTAAGFALLGLAAIGLIWPYALALPLCAFAIWMGIALLSRARAMRRVSASGDLATSRKAAEK
ncbi:MAG TPA: phospholipase D-like domain-containing protein [Burkholderiales bacterium]|nr:phospholipase D-like domain-containing protein [Burkholderiales bacterium]